MAHDKRVSMHGTWCLYNPKALKPGTKKIEGLELMNAKDMKAQDMKA